MSLFGLFGKKLTLPSADEALPGRSTSMSVPDQHYVNGNPLTPPFPEEMEQAMFGLGCFWGAERRFWQQEGVYVTAVGYASGLTPNPTYQEVCTGMTGHNEVVRVIFDPSVISYEKLLQVFWESHNPTQGMQQGNDVGTQYRSGIYTYTHQQQVLALASQKIYQDALAQAGLGGITTEILDAPEFYYAEAYHQQYLAKNPGGYCGLGGTRVTCPPLVEA
ncbi:peptide-methionine (S)-S-oxide reductase MsrA [Acaryochloris sp. IP29b_bin.137]|uniref:peptide-methionine (S)-S-oxide reductase MsrA n=1 Tax=Acaryochloris sp. IP29b_bin.137 TaxID=2969217 RepID=UPI002637B1A1|nr:peptide-methionine (S)-S-oxide reductase MsrA [Acaryochloris sp. IP29b_bin.137]